ncbi:hypothetical protein EFA69_06480 [Rufibacter immobilis]|uniref:Uncharacterized protein n=1 Tax=Rufibacter immobilis TaxID=1348778 RepID=A0A3M9N1A2_9BACT|nr:hypothetical protein [Rufibacter immobilis]RNI30933.1 hypothetical protein EFA69_06480 [Rufibacter immobilis]
MPQLFTLLLQVSKTVPDTTALKAHTSLNPDEIANSIALNPWFVLIGGIVGVLGLFLSIYFYFKSKSVKSLSYNTKNFQLVDSKLNKVEGLDVSYKGSKVLNLTVTRFIIWNSGNVTIRRDDIASKDPLRIAIVNEGGFLDYQVVREVNKVNDFTVTPIANGRELLIDFEYLDHNDGIIIQTYHTSTIPFVRLLGTIKGIKGFNSSIMISTAASDYNDEVTDGKITFKKKLIRFVSSTFAPVFWMSFGAYLMYHYQGEEPTMVFYGGLFIAIGVLYLVFKVIEIYKRLPDEYYPYFKDL